MSDAAKQPGSSRTPSPFSQPGYCGAVRCTGSENAAETWFGENGMKPEVVDATKAVERASGIPVIVQPDPALKLIAGWSLRDDRHQPLLRADDGFIAVC